LGAVEKAATRKNQVQLINGANLCGKMRKSLGSKRNEMSGDDIATITKCFGNFEVVDARELDKPAEAKSNRGRQSANPKTEAAKTFAAKIFKTHEFGYRRITIERPLRQSYQFSDERIATLRFESGALNSACNGLMRSLRIYPTRSGAMRLIARTMATSAATKKQSVVTSKPISPISKKSKSKTC
jgi:hypothetical protein